ncbi:cytochrome P450 [Leptodontidium sp. MPI-SDFR-AT-0119]|nr:cytochrome P450 [Leptodontidium sp. MPI-SDFR-AT-0119]
MLGTIKSISHDYKNTPVRLHFFTQTIYFISGAQTSAFGLPTSDARIFESDNSGMYHKPSPGPEVAPDRRLFHNSHRLFSQELTGQSLAELFRQFIRIFGLRLRKKSDEIVALCGENLLKFSADFAKDFWLFDAWVPKLVIEIPRWLIPKGFAVRDNVLQSIMKWHEFSDKNFDSAGEISDDVLWEPVYGHKLMRERAKMYKPTGLSAMGRAANDLGMVWGANANVVPSASWCLIHILADKELARRVREEIARAFPTEDLESVDMAKLNSCPLLQSIIAEVLRLNMAVLINRTSMIPDFRFGKWFVEQDKLMLASVYIAHRDETAWNTGRTLSDGKQEHPLDYFWAERFLECPNDPFSGPAKKDAAVELSSFDENPIIHDHKEAKFTLEGLKGVYIPLGGGINMCPSRY